MKAYLLTGLMALLFGTAFTQAGKISLTECYQWAGEADPRTANDQTLQQITRLELDNLEATRLPSLDLNGQVSYQSDVVELPIEMPGFQGPELPRERFQVTIDAGYTLFDGGRREARARQLQADLEAQQKDIEVQLYDLREQVDRWYFTILEARQQRAVLETARKDIQERLDQLTAALQYGTITAGDLDRLRVRDLELETQIDQITSAEQSALRTLERLTDTTFTSNPRLSLPDFDPGLRNSDPLRPEFALFEAERSRILASESAITAQRQPVVRLFLQTGLGYPNPLNFFDDALSPFALGGIRASWTITDWKQHQRQREQLTLRADLLERREASLRQGITRTEAAYQERLQQLDNQLEKQASVLELRRRILAQSQQRLDRGLITTTDYLEDLHAQTQAYLRVDQLQLQRLRLQAEYRTRFGLPISQQ